MVYGGVCFLVGIVNKGRMSFQSLNTVLRDVGEPSQFLGKRSSHFQQVLQHWSSIVGADLALHTRPHRLDRQVLKVATSSAVWAQNLQFERHRLRLKILEQVNLDLKDIQFSTAYWQMPTPTDQSLASTQEQQEWQNHPSRIVVQSGLTVQRGRILGNPERRTVAAQFSAWATACQLRNRSLPRCPRCQSPTPPGELSRWKMCSFCMGQQCHHP